MLTLHAYILRELLKAFGLTILALSGLFTMAGGLFDALRFEGVTPGDLFTVLPMLFPIVLTFTMPVAALFAATLTYGRLAADNELVAARAAGINIHRLFLSAMLLSVFVALFTALSANLVIPEFMKRLEYYARGNVRDMAYHRLLQRGYIRYGKRGKDQYILTAQQVLAVDPEELVAKGFDRPGEHVSYFWVEQPTFLLIDGHGQLKRFSLAQGGLCQFDTRRNRVEVTIYVKDARDFEPGKSVAQIELQKIGPYPAPIRFPVRPSMLDIKTLYAWRNAPWRSPDLAREIDGLLLKIRGYVFYVEAARQLAAGEPLRLSDADGALYEIFAGQCVADRKSLTLLDVRVTRHEPQARRVTSFAAHRGRLAAVGTDGGSEVVLRLTRDEEQAVVEYAGQGPQQRRARKHDEWTARGLQIPPDIAQRVAAITPREVLDEAAALPGQEVFGEARSRVIADAAKLRRKVTGLIHFRLGYSLSALVTIVMGAALGVVFRGSRALAAFGLACIPFGTVTILMLMGRQLTEHEATETIGPLIIWGGLLLVALADVLILRVGVRR